MKTFEDRKKAHEGKFVLDQDKHFRATVVRNKMLGLWVAEQFGHSGKEAEVYAKDIIRTDFDEPGDDDIIRKLKADFVRKGLDFDERTVRKKMNTLMAEAIKNLEARG